MKQPKPIITLEQEIFLLFKKRKGNVDRVRIRQIAKGIWNYSIDVKWEQ